VETKSLHNSSHFLKNDKCTALQGSNLVTDSGRERDFPVHNDVQTEYKIQPGPIHLALGGGGGGRSSWTNSAYSLFLARQPPSGPGPPHSRCF
jgi:hypothetical protein